MKNLGIFGWLYVIPFLFLLDSWIWNVHTIHGAEKWRFEFQNNATGWSGPTVPVYTWGYFLLGASLVALFLIALGIIVQIMNQAAQLEAAQEKKVTWHSIWSVVKKFGWRMLGLYIVVGILTVIGFILLIIPGLIVIRRYFLSPYILMDKNCKISEAMRRSVDMTKDHTGSIWSILGVMFLISLTNIIPVIGGVIAFVLGALYSIAPAIRYEELKKLS